MVTIFLVAKLITVIVPLPRLVTYSRRALPEAVRVRAGGNETRPTVAASISQTPPLLSAT